jgi:Domain of unknown function (DUF3854)
MLYGFDTALAENQRRPVSWGEGAKIAQDRGLGKEYRQRRGFGKPSQIDTCFWSWVAHYPELVDLGAEILNHTPVLEYEDFVAECLGSDIRMGMIAANVRHIINGSESLGGWADYQVDLDREIGSSYPVLDTLNIPVTRFYETTDGETWNRPDLKFGGEIYAFWSERSGFFNCKPRIPKWDKEKGKYRKYESRRKNPGEEGNKVFFPNVDRDACIALLAHAISIDRGDVAIFIINCLEQILSLATSNRIVWIESCLKFLDTITPDNYWDFIFAHSRIRIGITEGAKKAISLTDGGFPCVAVLGICNWSISGSNPRELLPQLAELAAGGRRIDVWYDCENPHERVRSFYNVLSQARRLLGAMIRAGASDRSQVTFWDYELGKGIDDVRAALRAKGIDPLVWTIDTLTRSKHRALYSRIEETYRTRIPIRSTVGDFVPDGIELTPNRNVAIMADTGSGKTYQITKLVKAAIASGKFVAMFAPTNKLGIQIADTLGLPHRNMLDANGDYLDRGDILYLAKGAGGIVICPDSLEWVRSIIKDRKYIVVCDEAAKIAEHLCVGNTIKDRYSQINLGFAELLRGAESCILAEAKLSEADLDFFEQISGKEIDSYIHHRNTAKRKVKFYEGGREVIYRSLLDEVDERLDRGESILIPCDSQRLSEKIHAYLQQRHPELANLRVDAHTGYLAEVKEFSSDPNRFLAQHQLRYAIFSPACKAGLNLTGCDRLGQAYHFDAVCCFFGVLATSDHIQMVARYRPAVPLSIAIVESILPSGDERYSSRELQQLESEEATIDNRYCPFPSNFIRSDLQPIFTAKYYHNVLRNGLEKQIARYSLMERLKADGHEISVELMPPLSEFEQGAKQYKDSVVAIAQGRSVDSLLFSSLESIAARFNRFKIIGQRLLELGESIDRDWASTIAEVEIRPEDNLDIAAAIDRLEAPTPQQRARAEKIRLRQRFVGVNFDDPTITYYTTKNHRSLATGAELTVKVRYEEIIGRTQFQRNNNLLLDPLFAPHHLTRDLNVVRLLQASGVLSLLDPACKYAASTSEIVTLKQWCVDPRNARACRRYLKLDFRDEQPTITFFTRLARKLGYRVGSERTGTGARERLYYIESIASIEHKVELLLAQKVELESRILVSRPQQRNRVLAKIARIETIMTPLVVAAISLSVRQELINGAIKRFDTASKDLLSKDKTILDADNLDKLSSLQHTQLQFNLSKYKYIS